MAKQKKKLSFPTAITVLFIVLIFAAALTFIIPSGQFAKLSYDSEQNLFQISSPDGEINYMPANQESLDKLGVTGSIDKILDGSISKAIAIPNTYERLEGNPQGIWDILSAAVHGVYDSIDIIMFVFVICGMINVLNYTGAFNAGIASLSKLTKGKEFLLIIFITFIIAAGGTTFGLAEETIALYPILLPIFLSSGYDAVTCVSAIYMGSSVGGMFATTNPFSLGNAANSAGMSIADGMVFRVIGLVIATIITIIYTLAYAKRIKFEPSKSLCYENRQYHMDKFGQQDTVHEFTWRMKLSLILLASTFILLVFGIVFKSWAFDSMTVLFLISSLILAFISGIGEKAFVDQFISGAADVLGVAFIIGIARGVNIILENGMISDTILNSFSGMVTQMSPIIFILLMFLIFIVLGFFIQSSSGLAVLSIPVLAPLADSVGVSRDVIMSAYVFGLGLVSAISPTGLILSSLTMVKVSYSKWLKFIMPLFAILAVLAAILLCIQVAL